MKIKIFIILILPIIYSCSFPKNNSYTFNENEVYKLINNHLYQDLINKNDNQIIFYNKQPTTFLKSLTEIPKSEFINDIQLFENPISNDTIIKEQFDFPQYTNKKWNEKNYYKIRVFDDKTFKEKKNYDKTEPFHIKMKREFNTNHFYEVSYPEYNVKTKVAIFRIEKIETDLYNHKTCIPNVHYFVYIRTGNNWKSLKEYGTKNVYLTLSKYFNSTNQQNKDIQKNYKERKNESVTNLINSRIFNKATNQYGDLVDFNFIIDSTNKINYEKIEFNKLNITAYDSIYIGKRNDTIFTFDQTIGFMEVFLIMNKEKKSYLGRIGMDYRIELINSPDSIFEFNLEKIKNKKNSDHILMGFDYPNLTISQIKLTKKGKITNIIIEQK